jgi:DNA-binding NtrC family response regulator
LPADWHRGGAHRSSSRTPRFCHRIENVAPSGNTKLFHTELQGRMIETIPTDTMDFFIDYAWPGNIRELQNLIERAVILPSWPCEGQLDRLKSPAPPLCRVRRNTKL